MVTDEAKNRLAVIDPALGPVRRFIAVLGRPQYVAAAPGRVLVTSPAAGTVTVLTGRPLRVARVLRGLVAPHLIEIAPDRRTAYITDDARGTLEAIDLATSRVRGSVLVGAHAHHFALSPDGRRAWVALGESASTIVIVDTSSPRRLRVVHRFDPGVLVHDLSFSADGRRVWVSSATGPDVTVFAAESRRRLFAVPVGPPPQHVAVAGPRVYLTSGYGSVVEAVAARTGRLLAHAHTPYGSFELAANRGLVVTSSLLAGEVELLTERLKVVRVVAVGPVTRDVEILGS